MQRENWWGKARAASSTRACWDCRYSFSVLSMVPAQAHHRTVLFYIRPGHPVTQRCTVHALESASQVPPQASHISLLTFGIPEIPRRYQPLIQQLGIRSESSTLFKLVPPPLLPPKCLPLKDQTPSCSPCSPTAS